MFRYILIGYFGVLLTAIAQIILKKGAQKKHTIRGINYYLNLYTSVGYFLLLLVTLINLFIFRHLDLKYALIFLPSSYILVIIFSVLILKEKIFSGDLIRYGLLLIGIIIFNL